MSNGFSDKSVSPCVYTPSSTNTPQLINTIQVAGDTAVAEVAKITTKIEPLPDWHLRLAAIRIFGDAITGGSTLGPNIIETNDGYYLTASYTTGYVYKIKKDFSTFTKGMNIGGYTRYFLREVPGTDNVILSGPGLWRSPDNFATLAAISMESGHAFVGNASAPSWMDTSSNTMIVGGAVAVGGYQQPHITKFNPTSGTVKARTIALPTPNASAHIYVYGVCSLGNGVFIASASTGAVPLYIYRSTDSGETWSLVYTAASDYQAFAGCVYAALQGGCVAVGSHAGYFLISQDQGLNWSRVSLSVFPVEIHPTFLPQIPAGFLCGNPTYFHWYCYCSSDYGMSKTNTTWRTGTTTKSGITSDGKALILFGNDIPTAEKMATIGVFQWGYESIVDFPVELAFQPTSPAKLASLGDIGLTLDTTGAQGKVRLYLQHYNDVIGAWSSLSGVVGGFTLCGELSATGSIPVPAFEARAGEKIGLRLGFLSTDPANIKPAPAVTQISIPWASDVTAPASPSFLEMVDSSGQNPGYRVEFGDLPASAREIILEGKINSGAYSPFSRRAKFETGQGYMAFRGAQDAIEAAGERNEKHVDYRTGLEIGDVVQVKIAAVDAVGNQSAFVESQLLTLTGATYVVVPTQGVKIRVKQQKIRLKVRP